MDQEVVRHHQRLKSLVLVFIKRLDLGKVCASLLHLRVISKEDLHIMVGRILVVVMYLSHKEQLKGCTFLKVLEMGPLRFSKGDLYKTFTRPLQDLSS